ncbi:hypothetical protein XENOCAPTIV_000916 [Xenoophorus captivus]|uniref:Nebulin n=1 Tax=Xenoophorus captivus TaxID=1517983 RepID=A0ABV0R7A2_9TELE
MLALNSAKIASDALYKKDFNKSKTKFHLPVDMLNLELAKKCQIQVNDFNYRTRLHQWTCLPDSNDVVQARKAYNLQSDAVYKADLDEVVGVGWIPIGSLDVVKAKNAAKILNDRLYRQKPDTFKYKTDMTAMPMVLAKTNAETINKKSYIAAWEADKIKTHVTPDLPELLLSKANAYNISRKNYREAVEDMFRKGYDMKADAVSIVAAKHGREIISDYKYKTGYRKQVGHHIGALSCQDDPLIVLALNSAKIASDILYKKDFNKSKTKFHLPVDMLNLELAKKCQIQVNDFNYRTHLHNWTCLPDSNDVVQARKAYNLQSDKYYREGFVDAINKGYVLPKDAVSVVAAKASRDIVSDAGFRKQCGHHIGALSVKDDPLSMLAAHVAKISSDNIYKKDFNKTKTKYHLPVDMLTIELAKKCQQQVNDFNYRTHLHQWTCLPDSNDVVQARKVYDLQSDWLRGCGWSPQDCLDVVKVKNAQTVLNERLYRQHPSTVKFTSVVDLPAIVLSKQNADNLSDYKYKEGYRKQVGHHIGARCVQDDPLIMLALNSAKIASDALYKKDFNKSKTNVQDDPLIMLAINSAKIASDALYKKDFNKSKTKFHLPVDMLNLELAKKCQQQVNDFNYRTRLHQWTCLPDSNDVVQARKIYDLQSDRLYKKNAQECFGKFSLIVDRPEIVLAKINAANLSDDSHEKAKGHYMAGTLVDFPEVVRCGQQEKNKGLRIYQKDYHQTKTKIHLPSDIIANQVAKRCQDMLSDILYRTHLHQWTCHPEQEDAIRARKTNEILSDDDLNWMKGIGCYVWDTPEIIRAKKSYELQSDVKYKEDYEKFKSLYSLPKSLEDDPATARCVKAGKLVLDENYEKTKAKNHIPPDMLEILSARNTQSTVSGIHYRKYFHQWICLPDMQMYVQARKVNEQLSDDDLNWLKGIGCYAWDTPEILRVKHAGVLQSEVKYKEAFEMVKAKAYTLHPEGVNFVTARKAHKIINDVKMVHVRNITKQRVRVSFLLSVHVLLSPVAHLSYCLFLLLQTSYPVEAKKNLSNFSVVLDTPEYNRVTELKTHMSDYQYTDLASKERAHFTPETNTPNIQHARKMKVVYSEVKYKEDLEWLKGIGCYVWDTPELLLADRNKALYSEVNDQFYSYILQTHTTSMHSDFNHIFLLQRLYRASFEKNRGNFKYACDTPFFEAARNASVLINDLARENRNMSQVNVLDVLSERPAYLHTAGPPDCSYWCMRLSTDLPAGVVEYKYDKEMMKGCVIPVSDDKYTLLYKKNAEIASDVSIFCLSMKVIHECAWTVKYKEKYEKTKGHYIPVMDTPQILHAKAVRTLVSESKYKQESKKIMQSGSFTTLAETRDTAHSREVKKLVSEKFEKEKGKSVYNQMIVPPDVQHAMDVAKNQSNVRYFYIYTSVFYL